MSESPADSLHNLAAQLADHVERHDLLARAIAGCRGWFANGPAEMPYRLADIRLDFDLHRFCFSNAQLPYPYIDTRLRLFVAEREVGNYRLITLPDGRVADDYLVFE